ncbi:MAG TPA: MFS transporter [Candidatus Limnocylindrales bacterium]|nr:MFS transporter [Candidatus Limnocylindrales bacterium]
MTDPQIPDPGTPQPPDTAFTSPPKTTRLPDGLRAFRHYNFRLFWFGMLISLIGNWMQIVGQGWLILELTGDPVALGLVAAAQWTPILILGLFGGIVADAVSKRRALIITQTIAGALALTLGLLVASGRVEVWQVFALATILGIVNAFDMPIRQSFVVEMVGKSDVANAVALNSAVFNLTRIIGPAVAGVTIATIGLEPLFLVNAVSYIAVIAALLLMHPAELMPPSAKAVVERNARSVINALVEGLRYVRNEPRILLAISVLGVVATFALNFQVIIPVYARDVLGGDADTYGFLMSAAGFGSFLAAISIAFGQRPTIGRVLMGAACVGIGMVGMSFSRSFPISLALMFLVGWGMISMAASTNTIIQLSVPDVLRGRVMSVFTTVFAGSTPIGGLISGSLAAIGGAPLAMLVGGSVAFLAAAVGFMRQPGGGHVHAPAVLTRRAARHR